MIVYDNEYSFKFFFLGYDGDDESGVLMFGVTRIFNVFLWKEIKVYA